MIADEDQNYEVKWVKTAKADLRQIFDYIKEESPAAAAKILNAIEEKAGSLEALPNRGRMGRVPGTRELLIPKSPYIVVYQVKGRVVRILNVVHTSMEWPN